MVRKIVKWNGLSNSDKNELDKVLSKVFTKATLAGYCSEVYSYLVEVLDANEVVDMLSDFGVNFVKEERDAILDDDDYVDNISEIADYISDRISNDKTVKVDFDKVPEMDDDAFEDFLDSSSNCLYLEKVIKEFLSDKPNIKKQFVEFCIKKMAE